jgi:hypothetical protein
METRGKAVEKFLNVKAAAAAESPTNTIQKTGRRSIIWKKPQKARKA